eukprot:COSAG05_NODE_11_length_38500_cov_831.349861_44_plen_213_part_00
MEARGAARKSPRASWGTAMSPADVRRRKGRMRAPADRRLWEMFEGENQFYCSGRYISGPGTLNVLGTAFLIIIPTLIFVFRVAVLLAEVAPWTRWLARPMVLASAAVSLGSLFAAHMMDPGIIPRSKSKAPPPNPRGLRVCSVRPCNPCPPCPPPNPIPAGAERCVPHCRLAMSSSPRARTTAVSATTVSRSSTTTARGLGPASRSATTAIL